MLEGLKHRLVHLWPLWTKRTGEGKQWEESRALILLEKYVIDTYITLRHIIQAAPYLFALIQIQAIKLNILSAFKSHDEIIDTLHTSPSPLGHPSHRFLRTSIRLFTLI